MPTTHHPRVSCRAAGFWPWFPPMVAHEGGFSACVCESQDLHRKRTPRPGVRGDESRPRCLRALSRASTFGRAGSDLIHFGLINARSIGNKSFVLNDLFCSNDLDLMLITETWQKTDEFTSLNELCPWNCSFSCSVAGDLQVVAEV